MQGALGNSDSLRVHIVAMETVILRMSTVEVSSVRHIFPSGVERDPILLHAWNRELPESLHLTQLDQFHLMWYKMEQVFNILCAGVHFDLDAFDQGVLVSVSIVLSTLSFEMLSIAYLCIALSYMYFCFSSIYVYRCRI